MEGDKNAPKINSGLVRKLVTELYTDDIAEIQKVDNGETNFVYFVSTFARESDVVVRISVDHAKITDYIKEQWCILNAKKVGIPVPEILEVSNHIVPYPYSVVKFKKGTPGNLYTGEKKDVYFRMGEVLRKIHEIKTKGYGKIFDWSQNQLSKIESWQQYVKFEFNPDEVIEFYQDKNMLYPDNFERFEKAVREIQQWSFTPVLCHNDFLPKNVLINRKGNITAVLDWELAISSHPFRDLGKAILGMDYIGDKEFIPDLIEGYGMSKDEFKEKRFHMVIFDLLYNLDYARKNVLNKDSIPAERIHKIADFFNSFFTEEQIHLSSW